MAPGALLPEHLPEASLPIPTKVLLKHAPLPEIETLSSTSPSWLKDLQTNGYVVVKNAIPRARALNYQQSAFNWLKSFDTPLSFTDPTTWTRANLPVQTKINTFQEYCLAHEKFMWDARTEPGVLDAFTKIWGTDELLVSFDSLNVTFPNRMDKARKGAWEHIDQSPLRRGMHCVQGIVNLSPAGPHDGSLMVYPGSHKLMEHFFDTETDSTTWNGAVDRFIFDNNQLAWFTSRGIKPHRVCADVGDLILWDSRSIHYGAEPTELSDTIRTVIYVAYTPAKLATPETMKMKAQLFKSYIGTSHWPHDNIAERDPKAYLEDGSLDPRNREEPLEKPEMSDVVLRLAGVKPY